MGCTIRREFGGRAQPIATSPAAEPAVPTNLCGVESFVVPYTDDQVEVDSELRTVRLFRNAWNRQSIGYPDEVYTFDQLTADPTRLEALLNMLGPGDAKALDRLVRS